MFEPGSILIVAEKPEVLFVTVKKNAGYSVNHGWVLATEERNWLFVNVVEEGAGTKYLTKVVFVTDPRILKTLPKL